MWARRWWKRCIWKMREREPEINFGHDGQSRYRSLLVSNSPKFSHAIFISFSENFTQRISEFVGIFQNTNLKFCVLKIEIFIRTTCRLKKQYYGCCSCRLHLNSSQYPKPSWKSSFLPLSQFSGTPFSLCLQNKQKSQTGSQTGSLQIYIFILPTTAGHKWTTLFIHGSSWLQF